MSNIIEEICREASWLKSDEFKENILDKGLTDAGIFRSFMINIVHLAHDYGIDPVILLKSVALGFYYESNSDLRNMIEDLREFGMDR